MSGGGIFSRSAPLTITNSTISGNSTVGSSSAGGGIYSQSGAATLTNSTVTGNSGSGIVMTTATLTLANSIVLGNLAGGGTEISGSLIETGANIIGGTPGAPTVAQVFAAVDGVTGGGLLASNGGPVQTVALLDDAANPALDAGDDSLAPATDQRGMLRFDQGGVANNGANISDLGAFELSPPEARSLVVTTLSDVVDEFDGKTSLREAIMFANDPTAGLFSDGDADGAFGIFDTITFAPALSAGGTITLGGTQLSITAPVMIDNGTIPDITIDANGLSRVIRTSDQTTLIGLTITGGYVLGAGGGVLVDGAAPLTIEHSVITGNRTSGAGSVGGGIHSGLGAVQLTYSTVSNNSTTGSGTKGGGVSAFSGNLTITGSTIAGNSTAGNFSMGGGIYSLDGEVAVTRSTISDNRTTGTNSAGGGLYNVSGSIAITNSTISGNSTAQAGSNGGGVASLVYVSVLNTTVTGNSTAASDSLGGGIFAAGMSLTNSIVSGNVTSNSLLGYDNLRVTGGGVVPTASIVGGDTSLIFDQVAEVVDGLGVPTGVFAGVLADNGGRVQTVALKNDPTNAALDAGDDTLDPATDARGVARVNMPGVANNGANISDLGAFELEEALTVSVSNGSVTEGDVGAVNLQFNVTLSRPSLLTVKVFAETAADTAMPADNDFAPGSMMLIFNPGETEKGVLVSVIGDTFVELDETFFLNLSLPENVTILDGQGKGTIISDDLGARSLVVTILTDTVDPLDNETSLREAIAFANDVADADGDTFAKDTITFDPTLAGGTITLAGGPLLATSEITIDGDVDNDHAPDITIDANHLSNVLIASSETTLIGLTMINGSTVVKGGAVASSGNLTIEDSAFFGNSTNGDYAGGGAIYGSQKVTITNSVISGNSTNGPNSKGGGVYSDEELVITGSIISGNSTAGSGSDGGGVFTRFGASGPFGTIRLTDSTVSGNSTTGDGSSGGGIFATGNLYLTNSTVSGNSTRGDFSDGGGISSESAISLTNSTISGNSTAGFGSQGGGIYNSGAGVTLINSTVSGNRTSGLSSQGGGIYATSDPIDLTNSIVLGNATTLAGVDGDEIDGIALLNESGPNIIGGAPGAPAPADVFAAIDGATGGGLLADNGGPVQTIALKASTSNPALDAGDDTLAPATDARGEARFDFAGVANNGGNISDLGAFEVTNVAPFVANAIPDQSSFEDLPWLFTFAANAFTDPEVAPLTYTATLANDAPLPAWLTFTPATRTFSGTPPLDFFGVFDIKVTASDGSLSVSDVFKLTIVDVADNEPPDAVDDTVAAQFNAPTNYTSAQLLANDSDPENNPFRIIAVFNPIGGSVSASDTGVVTFTPVAGFSGQASFRYAIGDSFGGSDSATVTVNVAGPPSPPVPPTTPDPHAPVAPSSNAVWTVANFASPTVVIGASDPDGDIVSYAVKPGSGPAKGSVSFAGDTFVYSPVSGAQGTDAFTIRISDAGGRSAEQVVNVSIVPVPTPSDWLYLADDGERVTLGGKGQVFATTDVQEITVVPVPGMLSLDGSFNAGGDVVRLSGVAAQWQVVRSGSGAILTDGATFVQIPAGPAGLALVFEDGMRSLKIDTATSSIKIGSQALTDNYATLTAPAQVLSLPTGFDTSAHGVLLMDEQGTAIVKGTMQVFGTPADGERIVMLGGTIGFDGSFNGGGDTIVFPGPAASFSAQVQASAVVVARTGLSAQIPFGLEATTLAFTDAAHPLYFDGASSVFIGNQTIGATSALLTFA